MNTFKVCVIDRDFGQYGSSRTYTFESAESLEVFAARIHREGFVVDWEGRWFAGTVKRWWSPSAVSWIELEPGE